MPKEIEKFSVSMPAALKQQVEARIVEGSMFAEDRSSVIARDLSRLYDGLLKQGLKTLRNAHFTPDELVFIGDVYAGGVYAGGSQPSHFIFNLEEEKDFLESIHGVDVEGFFAKIHALDVAAIYALIDFFEHNDEIYTDFEVKPSNGKQAVKRVELDVPSELFEQLHEDARLSGRSLSKQYEWMARQIRSRVSESKLHGEVDIDDEVSFFSKDSPEDIPEQ